MIKLYVLYLILGVYLFFESFCIWIFSLNGVSIITYLALASSIVLFSFATGLSLYKAKAASIIALLCMIGILPFAIHWIYYLTYNEDWSPYYKTTISLAGVLYVLAFFYSLKTLVTINRLDRSFKLKYWVKLLMAAVPIVLLILALTLMFFNP
jgi:hypothetical protein